MGSFGQDVRIVGLGGLFIGRKGEVRKYAWDIHDMVVEVGRMATA